MAKQYAQCSFGDITLFVSSIETDRGRDIAVQSPAHGDKHVLTDRGRRLQRTTCELLFADRPGLAPYTERYRALARAADEERIEIFVHPMDGVSFRARCANLTVSSDADELAIRATCEFLPEDPPDHVYTPGAGVFSIAGLEDVGVLASSLKEQLADIEFGGIADPDFGIADDVTATVESWSSAGDDLDAQQVFLEVDTLTNRIDAAIEDLDLATDLGRWQSYRTMIRLRYALVRAAESFTSSSTSVFDLLVDVPRPVIAICADIYGAALAQERADEVTLLNRIRTPGLVPRGTTLKMPAVNS